MLINVCDIIYSDSRYQSIGLNPLVLLKHYKINYFLNCFVCFMLGYYVKNVTVIAFSFIVLDFFLITLDNYLFFVRWPNYYTSLSLDDKKKYFKSVREKYGMDISSLEEHDNYHVRCAFRNYASWVNNEESKILKQEKELKEAIIKSDTTTSKDYSDKLEYFKNLIERLSYYEKLYNLNSLKSIKKTLKKLLDTLQKKPVGFTLIGYKTYLYLDEVVSVLVRLESLDEITQQSYFDQLSKVADLFSKELADLNSKILRYETQPIDVSLSVLLKELSKNDENDMGD